MLRSSTLSTVFALSTLLVKRSKGLGMFLNFDEKLTFRLIYTFKNLILKFLKFVVNTN